MVESQIAWWFFLQGKLCIISPCPYPFLCSHIISDKKKIYGKKHLGNYWPSHPSHFPLSPFGEYHQMQNPRQLLVIHCPLPLIPEFIPQPPMCAQFLGGNDLLTELLMRTFMLLVKLDQPRLFMLFNQYICNLRQELL